MQNSVINSESFFQQFSSYILTWNSLLLTPNVA